MALKHISILPFSQRPIKGIVIWLLHPKAGEVIDHEVDMIKEGIHFNLQTHGEISKISYT